MDVIVYDKVGKESKAVQDILLATFPKVTLTDQAVASFADGADGIPVQSLVASIEPVQSGSGDPSPENVRPISGHTGMTVYHSGADTSNPTTYPVSWQTEAGTVYGGSLDLTTGVLTVDRVMATYDGSEDENWTYYSVQTGNMFRIIENNRVSGNIAGNASNIGDYACNSFVPVADGNTTSRVSGSYGGSNKNIDYIYNSCDSVETWRTYLRSNPIQQVYPLANPTTVQLTAQQIGTLYSQNNIWASTGNIESLTYRADLGLYLSDRITTTVADAIASI